MLNKSFRRNTHDETTHRYLGPYSPDQMRVWNIHSDFISPLSQGGWMSYEDLLNRLWVQYRRSKFKSDLHLQTELNKALSELEKHSFVETRVRVND